MFPGLNQQPLSLRSFLRNTSCVLAALLAFSASSYAAAPSANFRFQQENTLPRSHIETKPVFSEHEPVMLTADTLDYDRDNDVVVATGHVEVVQGQTTVLADQIIYDHKRDQVQASGNISMLDSTGNVYFADNLEFQNEMKTGLIKQFRARLSDNSVAVAGAGQKLDENTMELYNVAYTPCNCLTENGRPKTPTWSIEAEHATLDRAEHEMRYDDAYFNLGGVPIFYTPYFSHPTPDAENETGLLTPEFMRSQNLGTVLKQPFYYSIAQDKDFTITPMYTSLAGTVMIGEYRQQFDSGHMLFDGSITNAPNRDGSGNPAAGHEIRGHVNAIGKFALADNYGWGFDVHRATDDTYLHLYDFNNDPLLTSRIYAEGFNFVGDNDRNYASVEGLSFQGLTGQDNAKVIPIVAPLGNFTWQSNPGWENSRFQFDANTMVLYRDLGPQSRRLSGTSRWELPYITDDGQILQLDAQLRTDIYDVSDVPLASGRQFDGVTGRAVPQVSLTWSYPFVNRFETASVVIEPIARFIASPGGGNPEKIPNEDSLLPDFTDANLFSDNRFAGLDRIENGPRVSYGVRGQAQFYSDKYIDWLFGQQYRVVDDPNFPISNDLTSHLSDYVGKVGLTYRPFNFAYRFRADRQDLASRRNEFDIGFNEYPFGVNTSYLLLRNDPVLADREVVTGNASINLTREWSVVMSGSRDLLLDQTVNTYTGLSYKNECINVTTMVAKDYTNVLDIEPSLTVWLKVSFKNLE